jgi:hypothetical protein
MRTMISALVLAGAVAVAAHAQPAVPLVSLQAAVTPRVGMPTGSSAGVELAASIEAGRWLAEVGAEFGTGSTGWQALFPLRIGLSLGTGTIRAEILAEADPGVALTRPVLFMAAAGLLLRGAWTVAPGWTLLAGAGLRSTACPAWEAYTGQPYGLLDVSLGVGVRFSVSPR